MFLPIGLPLFSDQLWFGLLNIKKVFERLLMGLSTKVWSFRLSDSKFSWRSLQHFLLFHLLLLIFLVVLLSHSIIHPMDRLETQISFVLLVCTFIFHSFILFFFLSLFFYIWRVSIFSQHHGLEENFFALLDFSSYFSPHPQLKILNQKLWGL